MEGEYPCSCIQPLMNRTTFCCRAVSVGSRSGLLDAWSAVMLLMLFLRRPGHCLDDVMLHVNDKKQNPVLKISRSRTHLLTTLRLSAGAVGVTDANPAARVARLCLDPVPACLGHRGETQRAVQRHAHR